VETRVFRQFDGPRVGEGGIFVRILNRNKNFYFTKNVQ